jgi:hypothetical protein
LYSFKNCVSCNKNNLEEGPENLINLLFDFDDNGDFIIFVKEKTILGLIIISGMYDDFEKLLNNIEIKKGEEGKLFKKLFQTNYEKVIEPFLKNYIRVSIASLTNTSQSRTCSVTSDHSCLQTRQCVAQS